MVRQGELHGVRIRSKPLRNRDYGLHKPPHAYLLDIDVSETKRDSTPKPHTFNDLPRQELGNCTSKATFPRRESLRLGPVSPVSNPLR